MIYVHQTADGGYILGGYSYSNISNEKTEDSRGSTDYWLVKVDANGMKQWDKTFGGSSDDNLTTLQLTTDGGYILGGASKSNISGEKTESSRGDYDYWVVKVDDKGVKQWDKTFGGTSYDYLNSIQQTADGGYVLGGSSKSNITGEKSEICRGQIDYWVVKIDSKGAKQWDKTFGGNTYDDMVSIEQTRDGGYILGGSSYSSISGERTKSSRGDYDYWVVKINANGEKQWDNAYGGSLSDNCLKLKLTSDGGSILCGYSNSPYDGDKTNGDLGELDYWIVKIDANGLKQWDKTVGGNSSDQCFDLQMTSDNGYILGGGSSSDKGVYKSANNRGLANDYWIVKLGPDAVLPVVFTSFTASPKETSVLLNWKTSNQINTAGFYIERSGNNADFISLSYLASKNTITADYTFTDNAPMNENNFYRLKQVDKDGKFNYSQVANVDFKNRKMITVSPNPAHSIVYVNNLFPTVNYNYKIINTAGKVLQHCFSKGSASSKINVSALPSGTYFIIVDDTKDSRTLKFIKY